MRHISHIVSGIIAGLVAFVFCACLILGNGLHSHRSTLDHDGSTGDRSPTLHVHDNPGVHGSSGGSIALHPGEEHHRHEVATISFSATTTKSDDAVRITTIPTWSALFPDVKDRPSGPSSVHRAKSGPSPPTLIGLIPPTSGRAPPLS